MIQLLSARYCKHIAAILLMLFICNLLPAFSYAHAGNGSHYIPVPRYAPATRPVDGRMHRSVVAPAKASAPSRLDRAPGKPVTRLRKTAADIGGPTQPELSSFKSGSSDDMVNLFTGDFSYNIPLLDVAGYPVNIFYDGNVTMEQDASWVGLGWNINPGNVTRNMRGVPDDFNGTDIMIQTQNMKPNRTWGLTLGADLELLGIKKMPEWLNASVSLGMSFNNYLGPSLDLGIKGGVSFQVAKKTKAEKNGDTSVVGSLKVGAGVGLNASSRYGFTITPNVSITASHFLKNGSLSNGLSLSTSYNSSMASNRYNSTIK